MTRDYCDQHTDDIVRLARWWLCKSERRKRRAMWAASEVGGQIDDVVHEVVCNVYAHLPVHDCSLSTIVCNQCRWTTWELLRLARRRADSHKAVAPLDDCYDSDAVKVAAYQALREKVHHVLKSLTYREREIIKLRYGLDDGYTYTLEEVGRIFKVRRERIRQIESKAIRKLQNPVRADQLRPFLDDLTED